MKKAVVLCVLILVLSCSQKDSPELSPEKSPWVLTDERLHQWRIEKTQELRTVVLDEKAARTIKTCDQVDQALVQPGWVHLLFDENTTSEQVRDVLTLISSPSVQVAMTSELQCLRGVFGNTSDCPDKTPVPFVLYAVVDEEKEREMAKKASTLSQVIAARPAYESEAIAERYQQEGDCGGVRCVQGQIVVGMNDGFSATSHLEDIACENNASIVWYPEFGRSIIDGIFFVQPGEETRVIESIEKDGRIDFAAENLITVSNDD